jgi:hypothetical protein
MSNDSIQGKVPDPESRSSAEKTGIGGTSGPALSNWIVAMPLLLVGAGFAADRWNPGHTGLHAVVAGVVATAMVAGCVRHVRRAAAISAQEGTRLLRAAEQSGKKAAWLDLSPASLSRWSRSRVVVARSSSGCRCWRCRPPNLVRRIDVSHLCPSFVPGPD